MKRYVEDAWPLAPPARRPTQLLTMEWPPKKPNVMMAIPATIRPTDLSAVNPKPASMVTNMVQRTLRRPNRLARWPIHDELKMPTR